MKKLKSGLGLILCLVLIGCSGIGNNSDANNATSEKITVDTSKNDNVSNGNETVLNNEEITEENSTEASQTEQRAMTILSSMTLEEKIGQMFIARCPDANAMELAQQYYLGGYILFAKDFKDKTKVDVANDISSYQEVSRIPMFIGVDEEGGTVVRVSKYSEFRSEPFESPQNLYAHGGMELIENDTREKSSLLKSLGINLNFASDADVSTDATDFIYDRTFGREADETAEYIKNMISVMNEEQMGSVLKHFPGYGNNKDTHVGIAYDNRSYETFVNSDFMPFKAGIDEGAGMIMVAHNIVYSMDSNYPASLSENVHNILREELGFDGVIITDDLSMEGVRQYAGDNGKISEEQIDEADLRILKLKIELGILY